MPRRAKSQRLRETLAANLRRLRERKGWSQGELASRGRVSRTYLGNIENCMYAASIDVIESLARALGTKPSALLSPPPGRRAKPR